MGYNYYSRNERRKKRRLRKYRVEKHRFLGSKMNHEFSIQWKVRDPRFACHALLCNFHYTYKYRSLLTRDPFSLSNNILRIFDRLLGEKRKKSLLSNLLSSSIKRKHRQIYFPSPCIQSSQLYFQSFDATFSGEEQREEKNRRSSIESCEKRWKEILE